MDLNGPALAAEVGEWENPDRHLAIEIDLTGAEAPREVVDRTLAEFDDLWGLVHCAGVLIRRSATAEITREDWDIQHGVNLKASFFLNQAVGEVLKARGGEADD